MSEEWTDWIEHDGKGCPVKGMWVEGTDRGGRTDQWLAGSQVVDWNGRPVPKATSGDMKRCCWSWGLPGNRSLSSNQIVRYRIRRPRALQQLREMIVDVLTPARTDA